MWPGPRPARLTEVTLPDGKLYMEQQPVLTRADLTEAAQLVDREGNNFVGLRFRNRARASSTTSAART